MYGNTPREKEETLRQHFLDIRKGIEVHAVDLRAATYHQAAPESFIVKSDGNAFEFEKETVTKLFCKQISGFGFPLFKNNAPDLNAKIMEEWLPQLKSDFYILWTEEGADGVKKVVGMVSGKESPVAPAALLDSFSDQADMEYLAFDQTDDDIFHLSYLTGMTFTALHKEWRHGLTLTFSDLGFSPLKVNHFVYNKETDLILGVNYGTTVFLSSKYKGFDSDALGQFWQEETVRFEDHDLHIVQDALERSMTETYTDSQLEKRLREMGVWKGVSAKFAQSLLDEVFTEGTDEFRTSWALAEKVAQLAKEADTPQDQEKLERVAGRISGLVVEDIQGGKIFKEFLKGLKSCS